MGAIRWMRKATEYAVGVTLVLMHLARAERGRPDEGEGATARTKRESAFGG